ETNRTVEHVTSRSGTTSMRRSVVSERMGTPSLEFANFGLERTCGSGRDQGGGLARASSTLARLLRPWGGFWNHSHIEVSRPAGAASFPGERHLAGENEAVLAAHRSQFRSERILPS